jgi:Spy/CpxP family protein refolding chaperone
MKRILFALLLLAITNTAIYAQQNNNAATKNEAKKNSEMQLLGAFEKAQLTPEEQQKVKTIFKESSASFKILKADSTLSDSTRKIKYTEHDNIKNAQLKEALGEVKYKALKKAQKELREAAKKND